jgi:hypothetical protein
VYNAKKRAERAELTPEERKRRNAPWQKRSPEQRVRDTKSQIRADKLRREWVNSLKQDPCFDCGNRFPPYVMDFDHRPGTDKAHAIMSCVSMLATRVPRATVLAEIAKCDLVCSNCHRERTHQRQPEQANPRRTVMLVRRLKKAPCADCSRRYPHYIMDFDHRAGVVKTARVANLMMSASKQRVLDEIVKCDLTCSNCHRERTHRRRRKL